MRITRNGASWSELLPYSSPFGGPSPSRARRQGSEIGLSGTAFGRIQGPLGGPQRSNPHTYVYHCILFCMSNMHTKFQLSVLINKKVFTCGGLQPQARAASRPLGELTHKYTYHWIPIYMNNMHTKSQLSNLINKKVVNTHMV